MDEDPGNGLLSRVPPAPPVVEMRGGGVAHLICWERHDRDGSWWAWISWVQDSAAPIGHRHHVVSVQAASVRPLEAPGAYMNVPRRVLGTDGQLRPWASGRRPARDRGPGGLRPGGPGPGSESAAQVHAR